MHPRPIPRPTPTYVDEALSVLTSLADGATALVLHPATYKSTFWFFGEDVFQFELQRDILKEGLMGVLGTTQVWADPAVGLRTVRVRRASGAFEDVPLGFLPS